MIPSQPYLLPLVLSLDKRLNTEPWKHQENHPVATTGTSHGILSLLGDTIQH